MKKIHNQLFEIIDDINYLKIIIHEKSKEIIGETIFALCNFYYYYEFNNKSVPLDVCHHIRQRVE